jgi:hypothetical protein
MKSIAKIFAILLLTAAATFLVPQRATAQGASVSFQVFYDDLSPYGTWVNSPSYGYVWVPNAGPGFVPYETGGHWVYTEFGWTWVSDYAWGWAPFHYGRWYSDPVYGSMWVPDSQWGPAWVTWRHADGYYGWAPMEPGISVGIYTSGGYNIPADRWCFVHERDFGREDIRNHYVSRSENNTIVSHSTVVSNTVVDHSRNQTYAAGPPNTDVQRATGKPVNTVAIHDAPKPAQSKSGNNLEIYRPKIQNTTATGQKPAPPKVAEMKDLKPAAPRNDSKPAMNEPAKAAPQKAEPAKAPARQAEPQRAPAKNMQQPARTAPAQAPARQATPQEKAPMDKQPLRNSPPREPANNNARPAPQQRPAPAQQPMRQAPQQPRMEQPRQAPQQQPMRQAPPQQQPRQEQPRQAPQQQPMRQAPPQQQPMHQAEPPQQPRNEPMREAPRSEPQKPH